MPKFVFHCALSPHHPKLSPPQNVTQQGQTWEAESHGVRTLLLHTTCVRARVILLMFHGPTPAKLGLKNWNTIFCVWHVLLGFALCVSDLLKRCNSAVWPLEVFGSGTESGCYQQEHKMLLSKNKSLWNWVWNTLKNTEKVQSALLFNYRLQGTSDYTKYYQLRFAE